MIKRRFLAFALVLSLLAGCFAFSAAEEEDVALRLVLSAVEVNGRLVRLDPAKDAARLDTFTFYADGTASAVLRCFDNVRYDGPEIAVSGLWEYYPLFDLFEFTWQDEESGQLETWTIQAGDEGYEAYYWGRRVFRVAEEEEAVIEAAVKPDLPEAALRFDTPFPGDALCHRGALEVWTGALKEGSSLSLDKLGVLGEGSWERYIWSDGAGFSQDLYLLCDFYGDEVYAYACPITADAPNGVALNAFMEAVVSVDAGFDGDDAMLQDKSYLKARQNLLNSFDPKAESDAFSQLLDTMDKPDDGTPGVSLRGHYMTVARTEQNGKTYYWFIYHNTAALPRPAAPTATPAPADGSWTCKNGHGGNTGNFCTECGTPKPTPTPRPTAKPTQKPTATPEPKPSFCTNCGQDVRGLNANFCPNCGKPLGQ